MTLEQLRIFVIVADVEHVTRASYALDMVQSAVSKAIATLEGEIQIRLFDRVGRNIRLTPLGADFREHATDLLDHVGRVDAWVKDNASMKCTASVRAKGSAGPRDREMSSSATVVASPRW